jgi:hypothetical protein
MWKCTLRLSALTKLHPGSSAITVEDGARVGLRERDLCEGTVRGRIADSRRERSAPRVYGHSLATLAFAAAWRRGWTQSFHARS